MGQSFAVPYRETLFEVAAQAGVEVDTVCGGNGSCGKCKVRFEVNSPPAKPIDYVHLSGGEIQENYRLSCQVEACEDMVVYVPPAGDRARVQILHEGVDRDVPLHLNVLKIYIPFTHPRQRDGVADWDAVKQTLPRWFHGVKMPLPWLRQLPAFIRLTEGMTIVVAGRQVIRLEAGDTTAHHYGVAVDIGSTTVVGYLIDLNTGAEVAVDSGMNKQAAYGDDLIARLSRTQYNPEGLARMHHLIIEQLNNLFQQLAAQVGIEVSQINEVTIVANMTMHHFLLQLDSTFLGLAPYAPVIREGVTVSAGELKLILAPDVPIYVLPNIAGFVGSDTVGVILASEIHRSKEIKLAIDVGTNGEVALGSKARLIACSAPAGPAFEGARIKQGMRAAVGAIDHVQINDDVTTSVIGDVAPQGICGSALIDISAGLLRAGILDYTGKYVRLKDLPVAVPQRLRARIVEGKNRRDTYFVLAWAGEISAEQDIIFTQQDVREFQLAKGAIRAGAMVLQEYMGLSDDDVAAVLLAGAFGNFIDLANARAVNLVPPVPLERIRSVGNAAGVGARLALTSIKERAAAERIGRNTEHIQLSGLDTFQKAFVHAMRFSKR
jgi:uncharacterized 2Fe-2S/4Fe-4S cluster protein (DUF4445 family)